MPIYVLHGFRWPRRGIRHHIILNNIDDAAPEYIVAPKTSASLLHSLHGFYPSAMKDLPNLRFVEQYDPADVSSRALSQPFAFVADKVEVCHLSLDIGDIIGQGVPAEGWGALLELRDQLAPGEKVGWYVVYNGDEQREAPLAKSLSYDEVYEENGDQENGYKKKGGKLRRLIK